MQITKIQYSKTVESQVMGAGVWIKIGVDANVSENENIAEAIEQAKQTVDNAHQKELTNADGFTKQKKKMDLIALKQYEDAIKRGDEKTIEELKKIYDVIA